jgi:hypothetical protein
MKPTCFAPVQCDNCRFWDRHPAPFQYSGTCTVRGSWYIKPRGGVLITDADFCCIHHSKAAA